MLMIHIMMDINEHQDQRYTRGDNNGRDLYLLGVNVLVFRFSVLFSNFTLKSSNGILWNPLLFGP